MNSKKSNISRIMLSIVALLSIFVVGIGVTYSWIEGRNAFSIFTDNENPIKIDSVPATVSYRGTVKLDPVGSSNLNLTDYDETSNRYTLLCFSPVSSADGKKFFFPDAYGSDGNPVSYRPANTNDIGAKLIGFNFNVEATDDCYLVFSAKPTVTVKKNGVSVSDTSAFRIMLSDGTETGTHIFSTADTPQTSDAVTDINGTKVQLTTEVFTDYLSATDVDNSLFSFAKNSTGNISVSIWLDSEAASSDLFGCDVAVDITLEVKKT